jgi:hypothetical protein
MSDMGVGLYRPVHVKTLRSQKLRMLLTHRKLLLSKAIASKTTCAVHCATSSVSDIDTEAVDSLKVLDPNRPIREATVSRTSRE